jgi:hypothetical protein
MLKKTGIFLIVIMAVIAFSWLITSARPSVDAIAKIASIKVSRGSEIRSFERLSDNREPEFVVSLSLPEGGDKFCEINGLTAKGLSFEPFSPRGKGYDLLLGSPGICYGERKIGHGGVYIVVRPVEAVIYVDDR